MHHEIQTYLADKLRATANVLTTAQHEAKKPAPQVDHLITTLNRVRDLAQSCVTTLEELPQEPPSNKPEQATATSPLTRARR